MKEINSNWALNAVDNFLSPFLVKGNDERCERKFILDYCQPKRLSINMCQYVSVKILSTYSQMGYSNISQQAHANYVN